jgi:methionine synthase I (cobalamin-dependent)
LRDATALPVWVKPNAGLPVLVDGRVTYDLDADGFAAYLPALLDAGAAFVGGCCGTTPAFIRALASTLTRPRR